MFFRKPKLHVSLIRYEPESWLMDTSNDYERRWQCPDYRGLLQHNYIPQKPDLPASGLKDLPALRNFFRQTATKFNGGLLLTECIELDGINGVKNILKAPQVLGIRYLAAYIFPFKTCSFGMKFISEEFEQFGLRESLIAAEFFDGKAMPVSREEKFNTGWYSDPYNPEIKEGTPMSIAENAEYDERFPEHPLTKLRYWMEMLEQNLTFGKEMHKLKSF